MRIVVLGAAGATGREVVRRAVEAGHDVVAFARSSEGVPAEIPVVLGDATDTDALVAAFGDVDAVVSTLGAKGGTVITDSTAAIVAAAHTAGVKRVTVLSSFAVERDRLTAPMKAMTGLMMKAVVADKTAGEAQLRASDLDWTIVYATVLNDGPRTATSHLVPDGAPIGMKDKISRSDVAGWLLEVTTQDGYRRRAVTITG